MKHFFLFFIVTTTLYSQKYTDFINSVKLGETREITIGLPPNYTKNSEKKYPLLLLLDGDYLFDPFSGAINYGQYWDDMPETIIIGIKQNQNNEREEDCDFEIATGLPTGIGAKFFEFIGGELLPYLEKKYRIAPFKIIAGHDKTAAFANYFLYKENPIFDAYISLNPDLVPKMEALVPARLNDIKKPIFYYQSTSNTNLSLEQNPVKMLSENIKSIQNTNVYFKSDELKNTSNYSLVLFSIPSALYHVFDFYRPISPIEFDEKIVVLTDNQAEYLEKKYKFIENNLGLKIDLRLNDFKAIETSIIKNKNYNELEKLAVIANKYYPKAMLGEYELALLSEMKEDYVRAAKNYQKAYTMSEIGPYTKDLMMEKVGEMKALIPKK